MGGLREHFLEYKNFFLDLIFPKECIGCGREGEWICGKCFSEIKVNSIENFGCPECGDFYGEFGSFCPKHSESLDGLWVLGKHENLLRTAIHDFKYKFIEELADDFEKLFVNFFEGNSAIEKFVLIMPIPLHARRRAERGFNQADLLVKILEKNFGIKFERDILKRKKYTVPQVKLNKEQRKENIKEAFFITKKEQISGKEILLIDDVYTTGSTMKEAAGILKANGAKKVWGLVLARGK